MEERNTRYRSGRRLTAFQNETKKKKKRRTYYVDDAYKYLHLPLLRSVADGVERHPVVPNLRGAVLLHQCFLEKLPDVAGFALVHGRLVRESDLNQILRFCFSIMAMTTRKTKKRN